MTRPWLILVPLALSACGQATEATAHAVASTERPSPQPGPPALPARTLADLGTSPLPEGSPPGLAAALAAGLLAHGPQSWPCLGVFSLREESAPRLGRVAHQLLRFHPGAALQRALAPWKLEREVPPAGTQWIDNWASGAGLSIPEAHTLLNQLGELLTRDLPRGTVALPGFGTWTLTIRPPRGEVQELREVTFQPERTLLAAVNPSAEATEAAWRAQGFLVHR
jgi:nucleoid DNA-binding protein